LWIVLGHGACGVSQDRDIYIRVDSRVALALVETFFEPIQNFLIGRPQVSHCGDQPGSSFNIGQVAKRPFQRAAQIFTLVCQFPGPDKPFTGFELRDIGFGKC
jgi:hypothetical protein